MSQQVRQEAGGHREGEFKDRTWKLHSFGLEKPAEKNDSPCTILHPQTLQMVSCVNAVGSSEEDRLRLFSSAKARISCCSVRTCPT